MTIDEAIKIGTIFRSHREELPAADINAFIELGIEALKAWKLFRTGKTPTNLYLLPGETKE